MDKTPPAAARLARRPVVVAWLPVAAWAALIFISSAQSSISFAPDPWLDFLVRKSGHMGVFGILALLLWRAVAITTTWRRPWTWALGLAVAYAVSDEVHQAFVAGREATLRDVAFDAVGAVIALSMLAIVRAVRRRRA
jgi:VanZ family protein